MKIIFCLFVFLFTVGGVSSQFFLRASDKSLDSLFWMLLKDLGTLRNQGQFFDKLSRSFEGFYVAYDCAPRVTNPLYSLPDEHMNSFAKSDKIPDWKYYKRLINLSVNGVWDADAVSYL